MFAAGCELWPGPVSGHSIDAFAPDSFLTPDNNAGVFEMAFPLSLSLSFSVSLSVFISERWTLLDKRLYANSIPSST